MARSRSTGFRHGDRVVWVLGKSPGNKTGEDLVAGKPRPGYCMAGPCAWTSEGGWITVARGEEGYFVLLGR
ncbi:MAG: hypothetical protein AB1758_12405 [Candidatus Eremiobacterota bacterium]